MAVPMIWGPIVNKSNSDPNGPPGNTSGNVPVTDSSTIQRGANEPIPGSPPGQPANPHLDPLAETYGPPPVVGSGEG